MRSRYKFDLNFYHSSQLRKHIYTTNNLKLLNYYLKFNKQVSTSKPITFFYKFAKLKKPNFNKPKIKVFIRKTKKEKKRMKKLLRSLTKKQKKKIKLNKLRKLVRPTSALFNKYKKISRNLSINFSLLNSNYLVHDGYSWQLIKINSLHHMKFKFGSFCHKTRVLSPMPFTSKGKLHQIMSQKTTVKIKKIKVKRKK